LATYDTVGAVAEAALGKLAAVTFAQGGINTQVPQIDRCPLIAVPSNRMYTSITIYDGSTAGQEAGGFIKGTTAKNINFLIVTRTSPIAVTKQDKMLIFTPDTYQKATEYAPYVECGHRTANHSGWVPGRFMLTISEKELQQDADKIVERKLEILLRSVFNGQ